MVIRTDEIHAKSGVPVVFFQHFPHVVRQIADLYLVGKALKMDNADSGFGKQNIVLVIIAVTKPGALPALSHRRKFLCHLPCFFHKALILPVKEHFKIILFLLGPYVIPDFDQFPVMLLIQFLQFIRVVADKLRNRLRISFRRIVQHCQFLRPRDHVRPVSGVTLAPGNSRQYHILCLILRDGNRGVLLRPHDLLR